MSTDDKPKPLFCSICYMPIPPEGDWLQGHNAEPVNSGRYCGRCNTKIVIPARVTRLVLEKPELTETIVRVTDDDRLRSGEGNA